MHKYRSTPSNFRTNQHWAIIRPYVWESFSKQYKEMTRIWAIIAFLISVFLKNPYLEWIKDDIPKINFYFSSGWGVKSPFSKILWGLYNSLILQFHFKENKFKVPFKSAICAVNRWSSPLCFIMVKNFSQQDLRKFGGVSDKAGTILIIDRKFLKCF